MMQYSRLEGTEVILRRFDTLTEAAREQLGVELAIIGREYRDQQRAAAPEDTGALRAGLSVWLMLEQLRVRVGLMGQRSGQSKRRRKKVNGRNYGDLFYGRIIEFGRKAQTVIVQRRRRVLADIGDGNKKRILRTSRGRKLAADIASTYSMKVKALPAHPFIFIPNAQEIATQRLANFWSDTLARAGA
ncbi:hypothetical protein FIM10_04045 [Sphingomonadales bacterium 56]|uniref:hypothetical protein n=1 Tax=Sphingobium sp. S6 TaxID=2758386 RepID=UPI001918245E|nr:hypothetical protein [Sphingobium sp. S6]MBY2927847.1 hypothetical protein [Sphingomonadales bacterium 56]CAD7336058.1 hypothetical protein SPHS6_00820 [Sphingobium sp. S6]